MMRTITRSLSRVATPGAEVAQRARRQPAYRMIGWHRFSDYPDRLSTTVADFERQLDHLNNLGACVLGLADAARRTAEGTLPPRAVVLTFDDGYASVVEQAWPRLRERQMPATFFVTSGYVGSSKRFPWDRDTAADPEVLRIVDRDALRQAAHEGLDIGSHTVTHPWLPRLGQDDLVRELADSRGEIEELVGREVTSLAYPTGGWNPAVRVAAQRAGYRFGVTVDRGLNRAARHPLSLRREFAFDTVEDFARQLRGSFDWMWPIEWCRRRGEPAC